jgi:hypothetical protein
MRALWTLLPIGAVAGIISVLVFHWTSDRVALRRVTNLILAHVLEFRLFLDEPLIVLQAQMNLLRANLQLLRLILVPCLLLAIPSIALVNYMSATYGRAPLRIGEAVVVSTRGSSIRLRLPPGIAVETPPVHGHGETAWRVRPLVIVPLNEFEKGLVIPFPPARILRLHWAVWFTLAFSVAAIGTKCVL